ncbi:MAG: lamin tail domain-containing protein [Verrucomicrobia bacterium]|nr:lamin tail domain-containing protein [Verrucomicrobiota bacterium]
MSLLILALLLQPWASSGADVIISEFMASNLSGITDEDGATSDWIEILNTGPAPVNLAGWRLTDDPADRSKWIFPSTNLPPNGILLVWADGKNRRLPGAPLHVNFGLSSQGEYLALARPDDSLASEFNPYPKQYDNISYGVVQQTDISQFLGTNAAVKYYIPSNNTLGLTWTARTGFAETGWVAGTNGLGFEQSVPGFAVKNYKANILVGDLTTASNVLNNPSQQSAVYSETKNVINYFNSGGAGNYGGDSPFPGFDLVTDQDDFVVEATGTVTIPAAGPRTFGVNSDDGFYLQVGTFSTAFPNPRGASDTLATFNFAAAGDYPIRLIFYERGGGSALELWSAPGTLGAWNGTNFRLVGDTAGGGLAVRSTPLGQSAGLRAFVKTDLLKSMYNKSSSAYLRFPFTVGSPGALNTLTLGVRYDDGFAMYLNGTLVATRNAPGALAFDSLATADRTNAQSVLRETIDLTPQVGLLAAGSNVLAVHGLNRAANNGDFLFAVDLAEFHVVLLTNNYFLASTPGGFNSTDIYNKVRDTHFSHDRGFYDTNFDLVISCDTPGATIRYTLDGTLPTLANGGSYAAPIPITKTTTVRAAAFKAGFVSSDVDTHTYLYTRDIIKQSPNGDAPGPGWPAPRTSGGQIYDYGMDPEVVTNSPWKETIESDLKSLPTFSIVMNLNDLFDPSAGIYANPGGDTLAWERSCSLELIQPDGKKGFHENCGIRIRGGYSRTTDNPKHAFRFFFRQEYGATRLAYPLFGRNGAPSFDKFDLRTTQNYSWAFAGDPGSIFLRDQFSRDTQLDMGQLGERGNWFHLYVNGVYWGLYNTDERAEAAFAESYIGGLAEDYDTIKVGPDQGYTIYATDGNMDAWTRLWQAATNGFASDAAYLKAQGLNADGTPNSLYEPLLDVPNLIDYMLVIYYGGNLDAPISNFLGNNAPNNWFGVRDRTGAHGGFRFMSHDAEHTLLDVNQDRTGPFAAGDPTAGSGLPYSNPQYIFTRLWANAEFRMTCADRVQKHFFNGGALSVSNAQARLDARTNEIFRALVPESARWGDAKRGTGPPITRADWQNSYDNVRNNYLPARGSIVMGQLRNHGLYPVLGAPTFSQFGGLVPFGYNLGIANPNASGTLYYTLDGSDPRLRGGAINPTAIVYTAPIALNTARTVRARVKDGANWSAIVETTFYPIENFDGLAITEIMYNPPGEGLNSGDEYEFVELKNTTANTLDLSGLAFTDGVTFAFTNATRLGPGQFWVIVRNPALFHARYPGAPIHGVFTGKLDNGGETLRVKHVLGGTVFTVGYKDSLPWPIAADGYGFSLVPKDANPTSNSEDGAQWRASANPLGSPGADDPAPTLVPIVVNELLTHTDLPQVDAVELFNPSSAPVNIGGWFLSDSAAEPRKYRIPDNTSISALGYLVFTENDFNNPPTATNSFRLSSIGDQIYLLSGDSKSNLTGYSHGVAFGAAQNGVSFGRYVNSQGEEHYPAQIQNTFGATNSGPRVGPVILSEIHYHPDPAFDEFVELQNIASTNVPLYDPSAITNRWKVSGIDFTFPPNTILSAGGYLVLSPIDPALFRSRYAVPAEVPILGPYTGHLQQSGERLELTRPDPPNTNGFVPYLLVDGVRYNDKAPWPVVADGSGPSLQRRVASDYADDPANWFASGITPGRANLPNTPPVVSITSPANGASYLPPVNIDIAANAFDSDGTIRKVEFFADGVKIGEDLSSPYGVSWANAPSGVHTLTARATDSGLAIAVSDPVEIAVFNPTPTTAISKGADWKYLDTGVAPANTWTQVGFDDSLWKHGPAQLGYSPDEKDEATLVGYGPDPNNKFITTWFRRSFSIASASRYLTLHVSVLRDDGAVVYLNGTEVFRSNMPDGAITPATKALVAVGGADETSTFYGANVPPNLLANGANVLAVEIHQAGPTSSDISFDLELTGTIAPQIPSVTWTSPTNNARFIAPASIPLAASASDLENGINRVEFYEGTRKLGQDATDPYTLDWNNVPAGTYSLRAVAVNTLGLSRTSSVVNVIVDPNLPPIVNLTNPPNGAILVEPASITVGATASDPDGQVQRVDFLLDDVPLGSATLPPYTALWVSPAVGPHVLKAIATDNRGVATISTPVSLTITNRILAPLSLLPQGGLWRYNDRGAFPGGAWTSIGFDDSAWPRGLAQLGYSPDENDEATLLGFGPDSNNKYPSYFFRHAFVVKDKSSVKELFLRFLRDDGIVAYLNGVELFRDNMPGGTINAATLATVNVTGVDESAFHTNAVSPALLLNGTNVLAVEIHQQALNSSDLSFDAELLGTGDPMAPLLHEQPISQTATNGGATALHATAGGSTPLSFQWRRNGLPLESDGVQPSLRLLNLTPANAGDYSLVVSNSFGSVTSRVATLVVVSPPSVTQSPQSQTVPVTGAAQFKVVADGDPLLRYQWFHNGVAVMNETNTLYAIVNLQTNQAGEYWATVENPFGNAVSDKAVLTVSVPDTDGDGLPDWWEDAHQLNKNDPKDSFADSDGDGLTNLQEYLAGTDPKDAESGLRLLVTVQSGGLLLRFNTVPVHDYVVQYSDSLEAGSWQNLKTIPSTSVPSVSETLDSKTFGRRFYRVLTPAR